MLLTKTLQVMPSNTQVRQRKDQKSEVEQMTLIYLGLFF